MSQKTKKIIEITSETSEFFIIRRPHTRVTAWCSECQRKVRLLTPEAAADGAGVSIRAIFRLIEAGRIHFIETDGGRVLVCFDSLF